MSEGFSDLEQKIERLLGELGDQGALDSVLNENDIDQLLAAVPPISLSANFTQQAMAAMAHAQSEREARNPAVALGVMLVQARQKAGLEAAIVAQHAGISSRTLEALELGQLSIRQILHNFPPKVAVQLLVVIKLAVSNFSNQLLDLAAFGEGGRNNFTIPQPAHRRQHLDTERLVKEVAEYVTDLENLAKYDHHE